MIGQAAHWALLTSPSALDASSDMATWYESCITLVLIAQFTHLSWLVVLCCSSSNLPANWLRDLGCTTNTLVVYALMILPTHSHRLMLQMMLWHMALFNLELLLFIHEHQLPLSISFIVLPRHSLTWCTNHLHLFRSHSIDVLISTSKLLTILSAFVDDWHILQIMDIRAFDNEDSATYLENVANSKWMQGTLLTFSTETQPCSVG